MTPLRHIADALLSCLLLAAACAAMATPQKIYRCGPDGRVLSQTPCRDEAEAKKPDGKASEPRRDATDKASKASGKELQKDPPKGDPKDTKTKP